MTQSHTKGETFPTDPAGLPQCRPSELVELADGDTFELRITPVANRVGDDTVRMLAYNGSIPGPTLRVRQGSQIAVRVRNDADHETTVHWHGLRLENPYDGVPYETQAPIPVGGEFTYKLRLPDDGVYWYHPHMREDYGLEMGLYGNVVVDSLDASAWPPANREAIVTLDDVLIEHGRIAPFRIEGPTHTAMGRFGNVLLTAGSTELNLEARAGEVVRFLLTNTANTRIFNIAIPGARMKLVAGDSGRYEREEWVDAVLLSPSERAVVDVLFEAPGTFPLEHRTPGRTYTLGSVAVSDTPAGRSFVTEFETLHQNEELIRARQQLDAEWQRPPDKTLIFAAEMPILYGDGNPTAAAWTCPMHAEVVSAEPGTCPKCGMKLIPAEQTAATAAPESAGDHGDHMHHAADAHHHGAEHSAEAQRHAADEHDHGAEHSADGLEWEDLMAEINARTDSTNMVWKLVDPETGHVNRGIDWSFRVGDRVKIRLVNTMDSDHPMHHPFHVHGAGRFLVLARDEVRQANLVWKDTVLVRAGETVDILLDVTSPGLWMAHCHIAEHNQNGMMFSFRVAAA